MAKLTIKQADLGLGVGAAAIRSSLKQRSQLTAVQLVEKAAPQFVPRPMMVGDIERVLATQKAIERQREELVRLMAPVAHQVAEQQVALQRALWDALAPTLANVREAIDLGTSIKLTYSDIARARPTPALPRRVESGDQVDDFLRRVHPVLFHKRVGMHASPDRPDGISQSANSGAELLRILIDRLVPCNEVWGYMKDIGELLPGKRSAKTRPPKEHHFGLISLRQGLDPQTMMALSLSGGLGNKLEDLKHDHWKMDPRAAREKLIHRIQQVEELLAYMAAGLR